MNYKSLLIGIFTSFLLIFSHTGAKAQGENPYNSKIVFIEDDWHEALKQAAAQHKYIFVDAYATWCGPCKMLKATTFRNKKAADFYNKNFINVAIDMEKGVGPQLASQWGMQAYPTLIIFNPKGEPVLGTVGYIKAPDLISFGEAALKK
ncbi:MAG: thioredoxin family protein [Mucilaginibacter sp.]|nr:thioredoxin family protein [Mucilaginibacter sp.]